MASGKLHFNVAIGSSLFGFAVSLALTPVMSRIYPPALYGGFAVANAVATIGATACLLQLTNALATARSNRTRMMLTRLLIRLGLIGAIVGLLACIAARAFSNGGEEWAGWWFVLTTPLLLIATIAYRIAAAWSIALGEFRTQAGARAAYALVSRPVAIGAGLGQSPKAWMMVLSEVLALIVQTAILLRGHARAARRLWARSRQKLAFHEQWRHNRTFTQFDYSSQLLLLVAGSAPVLVAGSMYGPRAAGLFSLSASIVSIPVMLISIAIAPAMLRQIAQAWHGNQQADARQLRRYFIVVLSAAVAGYGLLAVIAPTLFPLFLGRGWTEAGPIAALLCLPVGLMFVTQPFLAILWHSGDARAKLKIDAMLAPCSVAVLLLPTWDGFGQALVAWVAVATVHRLAELALIGRATRRLWRRIGAQGTAA